MTQKDASKGSKRIRYAVVGLGYISQSAVLPAFAHAQENSELVALVSSDEEKLGKLGRKYRVSKTYTYEQYGDCLRSGEVDAVYIALPNSMHRAYTEAAAAAGIHILCEKPMALNQADCEAMIEATERASVKLMIAYRLHFEAGNLAAIETIKSGSIGEPRIFSSIFSQQVQAGNSRLKTDLGAGPIWDMGIYCLNAVRYLFQSEPEEVFAWNLSSDDKRFTEVPEMTSSIVKFPQNRIATFTTSFGATDRSVFEVVGTEGVVKMDPAYEMTETLKLEVTIEGNTTKKLFKKRDQFAPELVYFSNCILQNEQPEPSGYEGLADAAVIEALLKSAETNRPVSVPHVKIMRRPDNNLEMSKPPVSKQPLVKAMSPGRE